MSNTPARIAPSRPFPPPKAYSCRQILLEPPYLWWPPAAQGRTCPNRATTMSAAWVGTACGRPLTLEPGEEPCCGVGATRRPAYAAGAAWLDGGWCLPGRPQHPGALAAYCLLYTSDAADEEDSVD